MNALREKPQIKLKNKRVNTLVGIDEVSHFQIVQIFEIVRGLGASHVGYGTNAVNGFNVLSGAYPL